MCAAYTKLKRATYKHMRCAEYTHAECVQHMSNCMLHITIAHIVHTAEMCADLSAYVAINTKGKCVYVFQVFFWLCIRNFFWLSESMPSKVRLGPFLFIPLATLRGPKLHPTLEFH